MAQGDSNSQKRKIKKAIENFLEPDVGPVFVKWVRRLLVGIWIFIVLIAAYDFINEYERIMSTRSAGQERHTAIWQLAKDKAVVVVIPALFFLAVG